MDFCWHECTLQDIFVTQGLDIRELKYDFGYKKSQYKDYSGWGPQLKHLCAMSYTTLKLSTLSYMHPIRNQAYDLYVTTINIHISTQ